MDAGKKMEKKKRIIETAYQLFQNAGIGATAIDDVVKATGIARGTFYLYFRDKGDLIDQLVMYKSTEIMKEILRQVRNSEGAETGDFFSVVRSALGLYVDFLEEHKDILFVLNKNISACMLQFPNIPDEEVRAIYEGVLRRFADAGIAPDTANRAIYCIVSMINSVCVDAILFGKPYGLAYLKEEILNDAMLIIQSRTSEQEGGIPRESIA